MEEKFDSKNSNILIITHGRSGSSNFFYALEDALDMTGYYEPLNKDIWQNDFKKDMPNLEDVIEPNVIVKEIYQDCGPLHNATDWIKENILEYDKIIILLREDIREVMVSSQNAMKYGFHNEYEATEEVDRDTLFYVLESYTRLIRYYITNNRIMDLVWYHELFTDFETMSKTLDRLNFDISKQKKQEMWDSYMNPALRYRKN